MPSTPHNEGAIRERLAHLIAEVERSNDPQRDLLLEHLRTASGYVFGEMPNEYELNLDLVHDALLGMQNSGLKAKVQNEVGVLLKEIRQRREADRKSRH